MWCEDGSSHEQNHPEGSPGTPYRVSYKTATPASVFNITFITVFLEDIDWSDEGLNVSLLRGFQLCGDLTSDDIGIFHKENEQEMANERPVFDKASAELDDSTTHL